MVYDMMVRSCRIKKSDPVGMNDSCRHNMKLRASKQELITNHYKLLQHDIGHDICQACGAVCGFSLVTLVCQSCLHSLLVDILDHRWTTAQSVGRPDQSVLSKALGASTAERSEKKSALRLSEA